MTITRDIIRVFYHTIMAVCSTVYIHLYWGSQKTESIILGSCFCWDHLQLGNSHIVSMIPGSGHSLYPVLAPGFSFPYCFNKLEVKVWLQGEVGGHIFYKF